MNVKDRRVHLFLQIFFSLVGVYQIVKLIGAMQVNNYTAGLFEFQNSELPFLVLSASLITGIASLISSFALLTRTAWAYGFSLFTSGVLFIYHLMSLGKAINQNSYEIIPIVIVLIVILQSFPFLLRRSYRSA
ncbi:MAG: hypothetical protein MK198_08460 [Gracilimonas sp.]|uniref:hypothetical protein n=1 Tax=Gracilimonas sp. TaxID=1974203 RepID=UPI0037525820|nr:hypothetical protein [Gracilimonas sp.]